MTDLDRAADLMPDDDPDLVAGMKRLAELRAAEAEIPDISPAS